MSNELDELQRLTQIMRTFHPNGCEQQKVYEAMSSISIIYKNSIGINAGMKTAVNVILHGYNTTDLKYRSLLERLVITHFIPFHLPVHDRMNRLLQFFYIMDDRAVDAFVKLQKNQKSIRDTAQNWFSLLGNIEITPNIYKDLTELAQSMTK